MHIVSIVRHKSTVAFATAFILSIGATAAWSADSAVQDVDLTVQEVNDISVGGTVSLALTSSSAGQTLTGNSSSTYSLTSNSATGKKITAQLSAPLETGLGLKVALQAPSGGTSAGAVALNSVSAVDVVTGVSAVAEADLTIDYTATAAPTVAPDTYSAEVTYTIVSDT
ncbi:MAG: hypothetical protein WDO68_10765 [Gammaproteobacteria bacterium]